MPELPEVETIVRELRPKLVGLKFKGVWSDREKTVRQAGGLKNLNKQIKDKKILTVRRRAKYIVIDIEGPKTVFIHQKISGHLLYGKWKLKDGVMVSTLKGPLHDDSKNQHIRVVFDLSNGYQLALADLRRFGKVMLADDDKVNELKEIRTLGPEPLEISYEQFKKRFEKKRGALKQVLMDPKFVVGIGNIYSDEILWRSGLHPLSRVEHLKEKDIKNLYRDTKSVL
ncbi:MAG TPA: DNA-formamidopyrimidine glycosylase family protein, partial [Candidatus Paceibacterota bacterium]|nr:DNA-formamidopyrimidine glycosylase family protein [Candidatus Paceibacterota bacterium]